MSADAIAARVALPFRVGTRTLARIHRRLVRVTVPLEQGLAGDSVILPGLPPRADGYYLRAVPAAEAERLKATSGMRAFVRQAYPHHYADLSGGFDAYLATFSAKSRSGLKRKLRKFEERSGGTLDIRVYRRPEQMADFHRAARALSKLTYQERLLDAGLPEDALGDMTALAARDRVRAFLLFLDGRAVAYLYAPAEGDTLIYAYLGYDPGVSDLSPGSVLQLEAMRMLIEEGRFRWFDFTEGDGQHKRQFATGSIDSVDLLLLRPTLGNTLSASALAGFDGLVEWAKRSPLKKIAGRASR